MSGEQDGRRNDAGGGDAEDWAGGPLAGGGDAGKRARKPLAEGPDAEDWVRELLAEDAYAISPSPVPYPAIRRQGVVERRRRLAVAGAVIAALAVVPVGTWAVVRGERADAVVAESSAGGPSDSGASGGPGDSGKPGGSGDAGESGGPGGSGGSGGSNAYSNPGASGGPTPVPGVVVSGPDRPATEGQLVAGVTFAEAADGLEKCLAYERSGVRHPGEEGLGEPSDFRILLAMPSTGDSNSPGDGIYVVAVQKKPDPVRLICTLKGGRAEGVNGGNSGDGEPVPLVYPDINSGKLYQQSFIDRGNWKLPFRWGVIGTYVPAQVTRVTASYGGSTPVEAALDHGWYVATGTLDRQVTLAPHLKGYDSGGRLVYDSDDDKTYERTLP